MHIIFVTNELAAKNNSSGGLATFTANMARIFRDKGNLVEILLVTLKETDIMFDEDITVHNLYIPLDEWTEYNYFSKLIASNENEATKFRKNWIWLQKTKMVKNKIQQIDLENKIDIIHFANHGSFSFLMDDKIPFVTRISGLYNIYTNGASRVDGSLLYEDNPPTDRDILEIHAMKKSPYVIAPSQLIAEIGRKSMGINPSVLESPVILDKHKYDDSIYKTQLSDKKYVLFYGKLNYLKGIHVIAHIAKAFLEKYEEKYLVLVGNSIVLEDDTDGEELDAADYVKKHADVYADRVLYLGKIVREELYPIIMRAEMCIFPSRIENLSNACIEAMAMGKIVVATNGASYEQLIEDGENGFLCERDNSNSFLQGIERIWELTDEQRNEISLNAKKTVERLSPEHIYNQYFEYYQKVIREWKNCCNFNK